MATEMHLQRKRKSATQKNGCIHFAIFVGLAQLRNANLGYPEKYIHELISLQYPLQEIRTYTNEPGQKSLYSGLSLHAGHDEVHACITSNSDFVWSVERKVS